MVIWMRVTVSLLSYKSSPFLEEKMYLRSHLVGLLFSRPLAVFCQHQYNSIERRSTFLPMILAYKPANQCHRPVRL